MRFVRSFLVLGVIWGLYGLFLYSVQGHGTTYQPTKQFSSQVAGVATTKSEYRDVYIDEINSMRAIAGVVSVQADSDLLNISNSRLADMQINQYYAHQSPDGKIFTDYFQQYGISKKTYSCENLMLGNVDDPAQVVSAWMQSDSHKRCLLDSNMNTVGFAKAPISADSTEHLFVLILAQR